MDSPPTRRSFEESCKWLKALEFLPEGYHPQLPLRMPQVDDQERAGISFFRTLVEGDFRDLTLPRTLFGRSEIGPASFVNTDLSESNLCWNDFTDVDFTDADLRNCDLRASVFKNVRFTRSNLSNSDLRRSSFEDCDFTDAAMSAVKLTRQQEEQLSLSEGQRREADWQDDNGEEPPGG